MNEPSFGLNIWMTRHQHLVNDMLLFCSRNGFPTLIREYVPVLESSPIEFTNSLHEYIFIEDCFRNKLQEARRAQEEAENTTRILNKMRSYHDEWMGVISNTHT